MIPHFGYRERRCSAAFSPDTPGNDKKGVNGFDYAYRYPGMNKVLQSAGRVIRTQEDTGIILLLDERFAGKDYRNLFPAEWSDRGNCTLNTVEEQLGSFWNRIREKN